MTATLDPRTRLLLEAPIAPTLLRLGAPNVLVMLAQAGVGEGVARLGAVQREDGDAVLNGFQQIGHVRFPRASFVLFDEG